MATTKQDVEKLTSQNKLEAERIRSEADKKVGSIELKKALLDAVSSRITAQASVKPGLSVGQVAVLVGIPFALLAVVLVVIIKKKSTVA